LSRAKHQDVWQNDSLLIQKKFTHPTNQQNQIDKEGKEREPQISSPVRHVKTS
jgi:hypothetical protein